MNNIGINPVNNPKILENTKDYTVTMLPGKHGLIVVSLKDKDQDESKLQSIKNIVNNIKAEITAPKEEKLPKIDLNNSTLEEQRAYVASYMGYSEDDTEAGRIRLMARSIQRS